MLGCILVNGRVFESHYEVVGIHKTKELINAELDRDGERLVFSGTLLFRRSARSSKGAVGLLFYCIFSAYLFSFHFSGAFTIEIWCCFRADNVMGRAQTVKPTGFPDDEGKSFSTALFIHLFISRSLNLNCLRLLRWCSISVFQTNIFLINFLVTDACLPFYLFTLAETYCSGRTWCA